MNIKKGEIIGIKKLGERRAEPVRIISIKKVKSAMYGSIKIIEIT